MYQINLVDKISDIPNFWNESQKIKSFDLIDWLVMKNKEEINIKYTSNSIKDVKNNLDKKFYFCYDTSMLNFVDFSNDIFGDDKKFSEIVDLFKQENLYILFIDSHEGVRHDWLKVLSNFFKEMKISKEKILYINNDIFLNKISKEFSFNAKKWNHLWINTSDGYIQNSSNIKFNEDRDFLFLSKNRMIKPHRLILLSFLKKYDLLRQSNYSCIKQYIQNTLDNQTIIEYLKEHFKPSLIEELSIEINEITNWDIVKTKNETELPTQDYAGEHNVKDYESAYINITTESGFHEDFLHISEKSLKPFAMFQLPIIVGRYNQIKYMKEYYKLDFFDDFIDHSYDNEKDNTKRMIMVTDEILRLSKLEKQLPLFFEENKERFLSNRKKIEEIGNWKETKLLNYILNM